MIAYSGSDIVLFFLTALNWSRLYYNLYFTNKKNERQVTLFPQDQKLQSYVLKIIIKNNDFFTTLQA